MTKQVRGVFLILVVLLTLASTFGCYQLLRKEAQRPEEAGEVLSSAILELMRKVGMPNGLAAVGYGPEDVDKLIAGTLPQSRITKLSPRPAGAEDLKQLFLNSLKLW